MLRQVYIIKDNKFLYERQFGKSIDRKEFINIFNTLKNEALTEGGINKGTHTYYKYSISYLVEPEENLFFIFVTGLVDTIDEVEDELVKLKKEFLDLFRDLLRDDIDPSMMEILNPTIDAVHKNLRPKISLIGFSGVGKTTITRLIKAEEIPTEHIPTITGDIATIKIGKLHFHLWDFAGQEQFSFLWNKFVKGSDAVLLISDSTLENLEKSKFFLELIKEEAPYAHAAVIANKQDLPNALPPAKIEEMMDLKTYSMVAIDPNNRDKMMTIIADILEMSSEISPLLKPLFEREQLIAEAQNALENGDLGGAANFFEKIANLCMELGDDSLSNDFLQKANKLRTIVNQ